MPITAMRNSLARLSARLAAAMMLLAAPEPVPAPASRPARPLRQSVLSDALAPAQHSMRAQFWAQNGDQNQAHTPDPRVLTPSSRTARLSNPLSIYFPRSSAGARRRQGSNTRTRIPFYAPSNYTLAQISPPTTTQKEREPAQPSPPLEPPEPAQHSISFHRIADATSSTLTLRLLWILTYFPLPLAAREPTSVSTSPRSTASPTRLTRGPTARMSRSEHREPTVAIECPVAPVYCTCTCTVHISDLGRDHPQNHQYLKDQSFPEKSKSPRKIVTNSMPTPQQLYLSMKYPRSILWCCPSLRGGARPAPHIGAGTPKLLQTAIMWATTPPCGGGVWPVSP